MTPPHDKLAGIKPGDRVRVTMEAEVMDVGDGHLNITARRGHYIYFAPENINNPTFQIERIEPPLKVGDHVRGREIVNSQREGVVIAIHGGEAWVSWSASSFNLAEKTTSFVSDLERIA